MDKKVFSGHQPNFLPYLGVFYKMYKSDVFVLDDDVQYSNTGLHNCNYLRVNDRRYKITIPVSIKFGDPINSAKICYSRNWIAKMLTMITFNYKKAKHFHEGYDFIGSYLGREYEYLSDMNIAMIKDIVDRMGIDTKIVIASKDVPTSLKNNQRNVYQCSKLGCNVYYSGIGGKEYNDVDMYKCHDIDIVYTDFEPFEYKQTGKGFIPNLSILDYIMNEGFILPKQWKSID